MLSTIDVKRDVSNESTAQIPLRNNLDHISVCICTYKRPHFLSPLLDHIESLEIDGSFTISICVVDNDNLQSASAIVMAFARSAKTPVRYICEPEQNIARARNRALEISEGSHVAFIDDDEIPDKSWLILLYRLLMEKRCSGVLGPVLPLYRTPPPPWILRSRIFDRPRKNTGEPLDWTETRTGNVLFARNLFLRADARFDEAYGRGGEDRDFFKRMILLGQKFVWCDEAVVREIIPEARYGRTYQLRRALLRGKAAVPKPLTGLRHLLKSCSAVVLYIVVLAVILPVSHGLFMRYLIRICDHIGYILSFFGMNVISEKYLS